MIWITTVSANAINPQDGNFISLDYGILVGKEPKKTDVGYEVDVINCGGYLFSAIIKYRYNEEFKVYSSEYKVIPETISSDREWKINHCNRSSIMDESVAPFSDIIMIAPRSNNRKNIRTENIDLKTVVASLPKEIRQWISLKTEEDCERESKNDLTIRDGDFWADTDGDGKIDWINIKGIDKQATEQSQECVTYLHFFQLMKGKWNEINLP